MKVEIYCDGSSEGNSTGKGGWSFVCVIDDIERQRQSGGLPRATNNIAELTGAINGLKYVDSISHTFGPDVQLILISDSQLVLGYANGNYQCKALHLAPLYCELRKLYKKLNAQTKWVKGHDGNEFNEICDVLAKTARESLNVPAKTS